MPAAARAFLSVRLPVAARDRLKAAAAAAAHGRDRFQVVAPRTGYALHSSARAPTSPSSNRNRSRSPDRTPAARVTACPAASVTSA